MHLVTASKAATSDYPATHGFYPLLLLVVAPSYHLLLLPVLKLFILLLL